MADIRGFCTGSIAWTNAESDSWEDHKTSVPGELHGLGIETKALACLGGSRNQKLNSTWTNFRLDRFWFRPGEW